MTNIDSILPESNLYIRLLGFVFLAIGLIIRWGIWKTWFIYSKGGVLGYIPFGLFLILFSMNDYFKIKLAQNYFIYLVFYFLLFCITIWLTRKKPTFIKPQWVQRIDELTKSKQRKVIMYIKNDEHGWKMYCRNAKLFNDWVRKM